MRYIHHLKDWPKFFWDSEQVLSSLVEVRHLQGKFMGKMDALGFELKNEAILETVSQEILKSNEIEGENLNKEQVRSSLAKRLGIDIYSPVRYTKQVDGLSQMMIEAFQNYEKPLSLTRLFKWHKLMFENTENSFYNLQIGKWRDDTTGPIQVVSGAMVRERVHFEAPSSDKLEHEMSQFLNWFNAKDKLDPVLKSAIAHLWFLTIHPLDDGNGRIARVIADIQLARSDNSSQRFYSMSAQILKERKQYYAILERTQKNDLEITDWVLWFLKCLKNAIILSEKSLMRTINKAQFWEQNNLTALNDRQRLLINKFLSGFDGNLTSSKWAKIGKCSSDTALRDIQDLVKKNILVKNESGGRSTSYDVRI
jgi:Fic family protein